jgi:AcrR family transcriptional regulator
VSRPEQIQRAAARLFAQRGYGGASVDDIGAAAGVSGPAIYWHYKGKQALLAAMLTDISERLLNDGTACVADTPDAEAAVRALVHMQVAFALSQPDLIVVHARELHHLDAAQAHRVRLLQRQYIDVWVGALQRRSPRVGRARLVAAVQATIGLINSTPHVAATPRRTLAPLLHQMALAALDAAVLAH